MSSAIQPAAADATAGTDFTSAQRAGRIAGAGTNEGFNSLNTDDFLKLLINELQNQDPLDPVDNAAMIQQLGQIREIGASDTLTNTLTDLSNSQQLVTASGLIGRTVTGLADDSSDVNGVVDRVTVTTNQEDRTRSVKVHVGQKTMNIENVREIQTE